MCRPEGYATLFCLGGVGVLITGQGVKTPAPSSFRPCIDPEAGKLPWRRMLRYSGKFGKKAEKVTGGEHRPFASRVVGRSHLESLQREHMAAYLTHHLEISGGKGDLFADDAVTALHQSSGGILRKAGLLARGAMLAAAQERCPVVTAEHVRIATTETL